MTTNLIINNSLQLIDDVSVEAKGKGRKFISRFIEAGLAYYEQFGDVLITKETLDKFVNSMIGCPVIIKHKDIDDNNVEKERVGVISNVWFNSDDGWYYCDGIIWDKQAIDLIKNQNWNVSCTYDFKTDHQSGTYHGKPYDMEFIDGEFLHLALVDNPRYERANIVLNSKDKIDDEADNGGEGSGNFGHAGRKGFVGGSTVIEKSEKDTDTKSEFETKLERAIRLLRNEEFDTEWKDLFSKGDKTELVEKLKEKLEKSETLYNIAVKNKEKMPKGLLSDKAENEKWITIHPNGEENKGRHLKIEEGETPKEAIKRAYGKDKGEKEESKEKEKYYFEPSESLKFRQADLKKIDELKQKYTSKYMETPKKRTNYTNEGIQKIKDDFLMDVKKRNTDPRDTVNEDDFIIKKEVKEAEERFKEAEKYVKAVLKSQGFQQKTLDYFKKIMDSIDKNDFKNWEKYDFAKITHDLYKEYGKEYKAQNRKDITMTVLNELTDFIKNVVNNRKENEMVTNEDKRKLIDEIGGILKGKVDDEIIRTIMKKAEELSYEPSEDDKADNKAKNEDEEKQEKFEEEKEIAENKCKAKNEDKEKEEEVKKEVKNSMDDVRKIAFSGSDLEEKPLYIPTAQRYELGNKY